MRTLSRLLGAGSLGAALLVGSDAQLSQVFYEAVPLEEALPRASVVVVARLADPPRRTETSRFEGSEVQVHFDRIVVERWLTPKPPDAPEVLELHDPTEEDRLHLALLARDEGIRKSPLYFELEGGLSPEALPEDGRGVYLLGPAVQAYAGEPETPMAALRAALAGTHPYVVLDAALPMSRLSEVEARLAGEAPPTRLLLRGGTLVDGIKPPYVADLVIEEGRIVEIGEGLEGDEVVELDGAVLTPGLIDSHVHTTLQPGGGIREDLDHEALRAQTLRAYVAAGVTTVLDAFGRPEELDAVQALSAVQPSPQVLELGQAPILPESYGTYVMPDLPTVSDRASLEAHLQTVAAREPVGLKVFHERGLVRADWPVIEGALADALMEEAAALELPLYVHAMSGDEALEALALEPHALMHTPMREAPEAASALAAAGTWVVSTLNITASSLLEFQPEWFSLPWVARLLPEPIVRGAQDPALQEKSRLAQAAVATPRLPKWMAKRAVSEGVYARVHQAHLDAVRGLHEAGVKLVMGSDAPGWPVMLPNFHATSSVMELQHLADAGLSPAEVLIASTSGPAEMLGREDLGRLEVGAVADLVVHEGDPLESVEAWTSLRYVLRAGELRTPEAWMQE